MKLTITRKISLGFTLGIFVIIGLSMAAYIAAGRINEQTIQAAHTLQVRHALEKADVDHLLWDSKVDHALIDEGVQHIDVEMDHRKGGLGRWYYGKDRQMTEEYAPYLKPLLEELEAPHKKLHTTVIALNEMLMRGDKVEAMRYYEKNTQPVIGEIQTLLSDMLELIDAQHTGEELLLETVKQNQAITAGIGIAGILFSIGMIFIAILMRNNISGMLKGAVNGLSTSTSQISATSEEHEKVLAQQASAVTQTTATMDELDAAARLSTEHADSAAELVRDAAISAEKGEQMASGMTSSMGDLQQKVSAISQQIMHLSEKTSQIDNIISAVTELANQTNMLALNAAVEAAHAGEQGKGFAVVAKEIRSLADQSKKSAERISSLVKEVQEVTNTTVMVAEDGAATLNTTAATVNQAGDAFNHLAGSVGTISQNVQQIVLSAKQQAAAIEQVVAAMNNINEGAKQSSLGLQQTREGVDQLADLAREIRSQV
ncbi:MAG: methyl-accepting chemotaxis protein [Sedimenticola sp.]